jgi:hypothetical protein
LLFVTPVDRKLVVSVNQKIVLHLVTLQRSALLVEAQVEIGEPYETRLVVEG